MAASSPWISIGVLLVVVGISAIGRPIVPAKPAPPPPKPAVLAQTAFQPVSIAYSEAVPLPAGLAFEAARAKGFFADEGVALTASQPAGATVDLVASVSSGALNIGATTLDQALAGFARGSEAEIVASLSQFPAYSLIVQPGIADLADLKGTSLAASSTSGAEAPFLKLMLAKATLRYPDDYDIVVAGSLQERLAALEAGSVAAALLPPPHDVRLVEGGKKRLLTVQGTLDDYQHVVLLVNPSWASDHPEAVVRFLRALQRSAYWLSEPKNKFEATDLLARSAAISLGDALGTYETYVAPQSTRCGDLRPSVKGMRSAVQLLAEGGTAAPFEPEHHINLSYSDQAMRDTVAHCASPSVAVR